MKKPNNGARHTDVPANCCQISGFGCGFTPATMEASARAASQRRKKRRMNEDRKPVVSAGLFGPIGNTDGSHDLRVRDPAIGAGRCQLFMSLILIGLVWLQNLSWSKLFAKICLKLLTKVNFVVKPVSQTLYFFHEHFEPQLFMDQAHVTISTVSYINILSDFGPSPMHGKFGRISGPSFLAQEAWRRGISSSERFLYVHVGFRSFHA